MKVNTEKYLKIKNVCHLSFLRQIHIYYFNENVNK